MSKTPPVTRRGLLGSGLVAGAAVALPAQAPGQKPETAGLKKAFIDGRGHGWAPLGKDDFVNVNGAADTWAWKDDGILYCTGRPTSVMRTKERYTNFELVCEWVHRKFGGNSGIFVWAVDQSIERLEKTKKKGLPHGIEVQVLDTGYAEVYTKRHKKPADWFTSHGDVFPVGRAKMKPFPPVAPNKKRSFPTRETTRPMNQWNHYYVRAINGEVRLWVNGEEVSGGTGCDPKTGYLCLESEGAPVEFRNLRIRVLP
ncbi:MAG: DUF1080 domain-containing protein [Phycisphaeraceae bacterium]|nr:DUF1080 domain-containing protein [Phycisphaeraceae bacterium]